MAVEKVNQIYDGQIQTSVRNFKDRGRKQPAIISTNVSGCSFGITLEIKPQSE